VSRGLVLDLEWMSCGACTLVVLSGVVSRFFAYFFGSVFDSQVSTISLSSKEAEDAVRVAVLRAGHMLFWFWWRGVISLA